MFRIRAVWRFLFSRGWWPLIALVLASAGLWGFMNLADEVVDQETQRFDERVFRAIAGPFNAGERVDAPEDATTPMDKPSGETVDQAAAEAPFVVSDFWKESARDFTALGGTTVITLIVTFVVLLFFLLGQWRSAAFTLVSILGGLGISLILKRAFARDRPDIYEHLSHTMTSSFPSGHSTNSAVVYLTLAILVATQVKSRKIKVLVMVFGVLVPVMVGLSRIAMAVHWPTDVAAGWMLGASWGLLVYAIAAYLHKKKVIEDPGMDEVPAAGRFEVV